ncbi:MAG: SH3 domain-containing protein [Candidatus Xenobia bacterium]
METTLEILNRPTSTPSWWMTTNALELVSFVTTSLSLIWLLH